MNGTRLSLFAPIQAVLGADPDTNSRTAFFLRNLAAGAACGAVGAVVGSPMFLIKARLQSQSTVHSLRTPGAGEFRCDGVISANVLHRGKKHRFLTSSSTVESFRTNICLICII